MNIILKIERTRYIRMQIIKYFILFLILVFSSMIGKFISKRYVYMNQYQISLKKYLTIQTRILDKYLKKQKKKWKKQLQMWLGNKL